MFIYRFIKSLALAAIIYFSAALAFQVNSGGDVEYYLTVFILIAALVHAWAHIKNK